MQYIAGLLLLSLFAAVQKMPKQGLAWLAFVIINALDLITVPNFEFADASLEGNSGRLRIMQVNIHAHEEDFTALLNSVNASNPDIISFQEFTKKSESFLRDKLKDYPYRIYQAQEDCFGIALFSKAPLAGSVEFARDSAGKSISIPMVKSGLQWQGKQITVIAVHLLPPLREWQVKTNQVMVDDLVRSASSARPCIIVGDLNATKSGALFKQLLHEGKLTDSEDGFFWQPSFPVYFPPLWIAIDHCLISPELKVINRQLGAATGSDHYPVVFDLKCKN